MPGKASDFPSRKERKRIGKKNVKGRMAGALPLYEANTADVQAVEPAPGAERNPTFPKIDETTVTYGLVREF